MVLRVEHIEYDVKVLVTEGGLADLRRLRAKQRAKAVMGSCAHRSSSRS